MKGQLDEAQLKSVRELSKLLQKRPTEELIEAFAHTATTYLATTMSGTSSKTSNILLECAAKVLYERVQGCSN